MFNLWANYTVFQNKKLSCCCDSRSTDVRASSMFNRETPYE